MAQTSVHPPEGSAEPRMRWWQRPEVRGIFWIWLVLTVLGLALCWVPAWLMGPPASSEMTDIRQTMTWFTAASAPVAALVCLVAGFLFGLPALKLEGHYLALATYALAVAVFALVLSSALNSARW